MAKLLKLRRGNTSQHSSFTGAEGEVTVNTDKDTLVVHDGSTAGGHELLRTDLSNAPAGVIDNADISSSAAIAGTKISPDFGSQNITTTGTATCKTLLTVNSIATAATGTASEMARIDLGNSHYSSAGAEPKIKLWTNGSEHMGFGISGNQLNYITTNTSYDHVFYGGNDGTTELLRIEGDSNIVSTGNITITKNHPAIQFNDSNDNPDYNIQNYDGQFLIHDSTSNATRLRVNTDGHVDVTGNLDVGAGLDVTGDIVATGDIKAQGNDIRIEGSQPGLHLTDTNNDDDFLIYNNNGILKIYDATNSADRFSINSSGGTTINGNLDVGSGIDVTGNITGTDLMTLTHNSDEKIRLVGSGNSRIKFFEGSTDRGYLGWDSSNDGFWFWNNQQGKGFLLNATPYWYDGSGYGTLWHSRNDGSGSGLDADRLDGLDSADFLRANAADSSNQLLTLTAGLRTTNLSIGETAHSNTIQQMNGGTLHLQYNVSGNIHANEGGGYMQAREIRPQTNNSYDLGTSSKRWRNIYTNDLNLSNEGSSNDVDGTWGDWTIQEGESDLFLKNNRSGKKYKFNLMEVS